MAPSVLIVDDEADLRRLVEFHLSRAGFATTCADSVGAALDSLRLAPPAAVVLDVMLPDASGMELCRGIRQNPAWRHVGVLMLTALGTTSERVAGLEGGADDYLAKPFAVRELVLRVQALVRRCAERRPTSTLTWRGLRVDAARHRVVCDGVAVEMRPMELKLLVALMSQPGAVLTRDQLLRDVWGISTRLNTRTVDAHVQRVRQRLGSAYGDAIETVHAMGYRMRES